LGAAGVVVGVWVAVVVGTDVVFRGVVVAGV
jgi:hypothetical protein